MRNSSFYRHYRTGSVYCYLGPATQVKPAAPEVDWLDLSFRNSEQPDWAAELGIIAGTDTLVFRSDLIMLGDWAVYFDPNKGPREGGWLRPHGMFFERIDAKTRRFSRAGSQIAIAPF